MLDFESRSLLRMIFKCLQLVYSFLADLVFFQVLIKHAKLTLRIRTPCTMETLSI